MVLKDDSEIYCIVPLLRIIMENKCAGDDPAKKAMSEIYPCPQCGDEVEIWTDETRGKCSSCGKLVIKNTSER